MRQRWPDLYPPVLQEPIGPMGLLKRYFKGLITYHQGFQVFPGVTDFFQMICTIPCVVTDVVRCFTSDSNPIAIDTKTAGKTEPSSQPDSHATSRTVILRQQFNTPDRISVTISVIAVFEKGALQSRTLSYTQPYFPYAKERPRRHGGM
ncbi:uncharacterized protein GLRG_11757 [Colletotrichum graminicola M1.001]|uniref:Uncharacterized protein n=1 Tax=Colletotrichum graminicola (strain M1.001 / M2 / FGSC 10212) TaxID=645133 RepID=E3R0H4_COLGM|nr:uncharacterized protein GLRG_11757 [Colletotrichum graminicola M1.001]EFQ36612.1 hypothetical protein GLRG_11757 [Colletotrichum graminicola M1.001]